MLPKPEARDDDCKLWSNSERHDEKGVNLHEECVINGSDLRVGLPVRIGAGRGVEDEHVLQLTDAEHFNPDQLNL